MILDTSAYSALLLGNREVAALIDTATELLLPLIVIGELRYGYELGSKQAENELKLERFLSQPEVDVVTLTLKTAEIYGELHAICTRAGRALSHNDLWVAALAKEHQRDLVTFDKDFQIFKTLFDQQLHILKTPATN